MKVSPISPIYRSAAWKRPPVPKPPLRVGEQTRTDAPDTIFININQKGIFMKTLILTLALIVISHTASAQWCKPVVKCDSNGCHQIIDCR